ncbi:MAG: LysR family transcriptional regulator [Alphaproteobacteria bacterium]|nr:LysR family transcriptional regulator [Alphaproteobacteria bacterium]
MNLDHMRAFLEVAATGNFNRAAERLNVTQSTISTRIKALEERLDQTLFARLHNGAQLTPAGHQIHRYIELSVRAWDHARQEAALPDALGRSFGIGVQFSLWERLIPAWIAWMRGQAGDTAVKVEADYSDSLNRQVADGILDLAVVYLPRNLPGLVVETLMDEALVMVSNTPRRASPGWVEDYVFVDWGDEYRALHSRAFPEMRVASVSVGLGSIGLQHILTHGGCGYFLEHSVTPLIARGVLHLIEDAPRFSRPAFIVYPAAALNAALIALAIAGLKAAIA